MTTEAKSKTQYSAPALSKGLDILELLAKQSEAFSLKQISDMLGRQKSELFRMLVVLEERGYIQLDNDSDKYSITMKLLELAHQQPDVKRVSAIAAPFMAKLSNAIRQSCHLVIERGESGIVIVKKDSPSDLGFSVRVGARVPIQNTCSGHVLLAFSDKESRTAMLDCVSKNKRMSKKALNEIVERVQEQGYECIESQQVNGVQDIGFPIFNYTGKVVAALVVPFLSHLDNSHPVDHEQVISLLDETADNISRALGKTELSDT